jgi:hypothetical protein
VTCDAFRAAYDRGVSTRPSHATLGDAIDHVTGCGARSAWYMHNEVQVTGSDPAARPCVHMAYHSLHQCLEHADPRDCPDTLIVHWQGRYSLPVRDGGRSMIENACCPWCGVPLPSR